MYKGIAIDGLLNGEEIECEYKQVRVPIREKMCLYNSQQPLSLSMAKIQVYDFNGKYWILKKD